MRIGTGSPVSIPRKTISPKKLPPHLKKSALAGWNAPKTGTAKFPLSDPVASLQVRVIDATPEPGAGYLPILYALKSAISARQAAAPQLADLREPYARPKADDTAFYAQPRLVDHLDATALSHWREFTGRFVKEDMAVLDLMASHDSHLPPQAEPRQPDRPRHERHGTRGKQCAHHAHRP